MHNQETILIALLNVDEIVVVCCNGRVDIDCLVQMHFYSVLVFIFVSLGAAPLEYIQQLSASNVSMDIQTFINLNESVVLVS